MIIDPVSYPNLFHVLRPTSRFSIERRNKYFYWLVSFKPKKVSIFNSNLIYQQFHLQFESNLFYSNFIWFFISFYFPNLVKIIIICEYIGKKQCMFTTDKSTISKWNVFNHLEICAPTMFRWLAAGSWLRRKCGALHLHLFCICILAIVSLYITMFMCIFKHLYLVIHMSIRNFALEHLYLFI